MVHLAPIHIADLFGCPTIREEEKGKSKPQSFEPELLVKKGCVLKSKVEAEPEQEEGWEFTDEISITSPFFQEIAS